jgi:hypothetical protein
MAMIARVRIEPGEQTDHDRLQAAVESRLQDAGGPPDGLRAHIGYPDGNGFVIVEAWRSEDLFRFFTLIGCLFRLSGMSASSTVSPRSVPPGPSLGPDGAHPRVATGRPNRRSVRREGAPNTAENDGDSARVRAARVTA